MSYCDKFTIYADSADILQTFGASLAQTLYDLPVTLLLAGELGAGKTTFVQGLARGLRIQGAVTSPTYALEQRYDTGTLPLIHLDLYRVSSQDALRLLAATEDHAGIRCIEWAEKVESTSAFAHHRIIRVSLREHDRGRQLHMEFDDLPLPADTQIHQWRRSTGLPTHIIAHCEAVAEFAVSLTPLLAARGHILRPHALRVAAQVHDLLRFVDFHPQASPATAKASAAEVAQWQQWKSRYPGKHHESACAEFLREQGYSALADIVEPHGFGFSPADRKTIEQKVLFYADKRVREDTVVTLNERFADFARRYGNGVQSEEAKRWYEETVALEKELLGG